MAGRSVDSPNRSVNEGSSEAYRVAAAVLRGLDADYARTIGAMEVQRRDISSNENMASYSRLSSISGGSEGVENSHSAYQLVEESHPMEGEESPLSTQPLGVEQPRPDLTLSDESAQAIREVMARITVPAPAWANGMSEREWRRHVQRTVQQATELSEGDE